MPRYIDPVILAICLLAAAGAECVPLLLILTVCAVGLTALKEAGL